MIRYDRVFKGLEVLFETPFLKDLESALIKRPEKQVEGAWSRNQITSKQWLVEKVSDVVDLNEERRIIVLGDGMDLFQSFSITSTNHQCSFISIDLEPSCQEIAHYINRSTPRFSTFTGDVTKLDYQSGKIEVLNGESLPDTIDLNSTDLIINTSSEHLPNVEEWYHSIKSANSFVSKTMTCLMERDMFLVSRIWINSKKCFRCPISFLKGSSN